MIFKYIIDSVRAPKEVDYWEAFGWTHVETKMFGGVQIFVLLEQGGNSRGANIKAGIA